VSEPEDKPHAGHCNPAECPNPYTDGSAKRTVVPRIKEINKYRKYFWFIVILLH